MLSRHASNEAYLFDGNSFFAACLFAVAVAICIRPSIKAFIMASIETCVKAISNAIIRVYNTVSINTLISAIINAVIRASIRFYNMVPINALISAIINAFTSVRVYNTVPINVLISAIINAVIMVSIRVYNTVPINALITAIINAVTSINMMPIKVFIRACILALLLASIRALYWIIRTFIWGLIKDFIGAFISAFQQYISSASLCKLITVTALILFVIRVIVYFGTSLVIIKDFTMAILLLLLMIGLLPHVMIP